ncbi:Pimeloyl-ACP methyl ester carboxylesterase [Nocardioides terrae]|uniref:Pimeloyl-ACP methyl ester carboxylesterase n=1 Tax=Nocardioides terrae TaxID=574651 RepID=A0A1I1EG09_9ACTN|nr:alpha/beta hydrolase [Nocardioides terrae]SFB86031.1 Pimeloyl-ACP methyl ester carboxylesterase [Nocardioides terrae]
MDLSTTRALTVDGCTLRYRLAGDADGRPVVLVHGSGAHAGWWHDVALRLADRFQLLIPDLSGHGESDHRADYSGTQWAREVIALASDAAWPDYAIVGHSMGGKVGLIAAAADATHVSSLVLVDTGSLPEQGPSASRPATSSRREQGRAHRASPTLAEALARFRLAPGGTTASPEVMHRLARQGLRRTPEGWVWKFDPATRRRVDPAELAAAYPRVRCPVALVHGAQSPAVGPDEIERLETELRRPVPRFQVEGAFHHVPVDQPEACARAIRSALDAAPGR